MNSTPTPQGSPPARAADLTTSIAYARELLFAVPRTVSDIYLLHQEVWNHINASRDGSLRSPEILYRRDGGRVSVRIGAAALRHGTPSTFSSQAGEVRGFALHCALWRDQHQQRRSPHRRVKELLSSAGLELLDHQVTFGIASGHKSRIDATIQLPVADLRGRLRIVDRQKAMKAWRLGVGRGRRFGFGMLVFQD